MATSTSVSAMDAGFKADLQEVCDRVAQGVPFSREEQAAALKRMERTREEISKAHGIQSIAVELIRESRESR